MYPFCTYLTINIASTSKYPQIGESIGEVNNVIEFRSSTKDLPPPNDSKERTENLFTRYSSKDKSLPEVDVDGRWKKGANHNRAKSDMGCKFRVFLQPPFDSLNIPPGLSRPGSSSSESCDGICQRFQSPPAQTRYVGDLVGHEAPAMARQTPVLSKPHPHSRDLDNLATIDYPSPKSSKPRPMGRENSIEPYVGGIHPGWREAVDAVLG